MPLAQLAMLESLEDLENLEEWGLLGLRVGQESPVFQEILVLQGLYLTFNLL
jgi:hypothetical protein